MQTEEFLEQVRLARERDPVLFDLPSDLPISDEELHEAEKRLSSRLPTQLRWFYQSIGPGHFVTIIVYSPLPESTDSLWSALSLPWMAPHPDFLPITDSGTGDYFGFLRDEQGKFGEEVFELNHESEAVGLTPRFVDFFQFLTKYALSY